MKMSCKKNDTNFQNVWLRIVPSDMRAADDLRVHEGIGHQPQDLKKRNKDGKNDKLRSCESKKSAAIDGAPAGVEGDRGGSPILIAAQK